MAPHLTDWDPHFPAQSPLFWPIAPFAQAFADLPRWPLVPDYNARLASVLPVRFVIQPPRPRRRARRAPIDPHAQYDARITLEGWVPTREESWHDFLNMLVWAAFPRAKRELHRRQHRAVSARIAPDARGLPNARTREQDGLAILDEGGIVLLCEASEAAAVRDGLSQRRTQEVESAVRAGHATAVLFGHALYEGLVVSGPRVLAMTHLVPCAQPVPRDAAACVALADLRLSEALHDTSTFASPDAFRSLPVDAAILGGPPC